MANYVQRRINRWFNRLLGAAADGNFSGQEEWHAANKTKRDYIWNTVGFATWGMVFPVLTVIVTQFTNAEQAGMFSMAFVTGLVLSFLANYGIRTYQVSDTHEMHSFSDYQINRLATCILMLAAGILYCLFRGYDSEMFTISMGVYAYRMIDGLADVYEGRLQQKNKLYLAGISQTLRSVFVLVVFIVCLFITRDLPLSCLSMAIAALMGLGFLTLPLALFETPRSSGVSLRSVGQLFTLCFPLFIALFLFNFIDNMPKFVMEGMLEYDNQLYFNALYFPSQAISGVAQLVYRPQLVRFAQYWADPTKRKKLNYVILAIIVLIIVVTIAMIALMGGIGISVLSFLYGIDFSQFSVLCFTMLIAGGVLACIEFLYQIITVLRQQKAVMRPYLITLIISLILPLLLVWLFGLTGAVISYLIIMCVLFALIMLEYVRIRRNFSGEELTSSWSYEAQARRDELALERVKRSRKQRRLDKISKKKDRNE